MKSCFFVFLLLVVTHCLNTQSSFPEHRWVHRTGRNDCNRCSYLQLQSRTYGNATWVDDRESQSPWLCTAVMCGDTIATTTTG